MDPLIGAALIGGGAALGLGGLDLTGGLFTNSANAEENHKNRKLAMLMAKKQMQWRVDDLRKAGLNPVLAANSGLSAGGGHVPSSIPMQNPASSASSVGHSLISLTSDYTKAAQAQKQIDSTVKLNAAEAGNQRSQQMSNIAHALKTLQDMEHSGKKLPHELALMKAQLESFASNTALNAAEAAYTESKTSKVEHDMALSELRMQIDQRLANAEEMLKRSQIDLNRSNTALANANRDLAKEKNLSVKTDRLISVADYQLRKAKSKEELDLLIAETMDIYHGMYSRNLKNDLLLFEQGTRFSPEKEKWFRFFERILKADNIAADTQDKRVRAGANLLSVLPGV